MKISLKRKPPPVVPIIPMIDILAILLVFFIIYTEKKSVRPSIRAELAAVANMPTEQLVGANSILAVNSDREAELDGMRIADLSRLPDYLRAFKKAQPERKLELELDQRLPLSDVIFVWDVLTQVGYKVKDVPLRVRAAELGDSSERN